MKKDGFNISFEEPGRALDPVRIYMREMGCIPLLTRNEKIVLIPQEIRDFIDMRASCPYFLW
jgi:hypothetical protein